MTTLTHPPVSFTPALPPPAVAPSEQRFVLFDLSWDDYIKIGEVFTDRPGLRITYDRGTLEFMSTSPRHERYKYWLVLCHS